MRVSKEEASEEDTKLAEELKEKNQPQHAAKKEKKPKQAKKLEEDDFPAI